jgi:hypothetical protein
MGLSKYRKFETAPAGSFSLADDGFERLYMDPIGGRSTLAGRPIFFEAAIRGRAADY